MIILWLKASAGLGQIQVPNMSDVNYVGPAENGTVYHKDIKLHWDQPDQNNHFYRLEVSMEKSFAHIIIDTLLYEPRLSIADLAPKQEYYWRVNHKTNRTKPYFGDQYSFFKTTSTNINVSDVNSDIKIIPTWVGDQDIIYIDNPTEKYYDIIFKNIDIDQVYRHDNGSDGYIIRTNGWKKGRYDVEVYVSDALVQTSSLLLK